MKNIKIVKNRSDIGAGTRGADLGIDAMEIAAINTKNTFFNDNPSVDIQTDNESIYNKVNSSTAKRIKFVEEHCIRVAHCVSETITESGKGFKNSSALQETNIDAPVIAKSKRKEDNIIFI